MFFCFAKIEKLYSDILTSVYFRLILRIDRRLFSHYKLLARFVFILTGDDILLFRQQKSDKQS
jgi:hypothetical protein